MTPAASDQDVVVIGAGPAGCMAARELARAGARVLLLERAEFPRWKVCGACVGPEALAALDEAGLGRLPGREGAVPLVRARIHAAGRSATLALDRSVAWSRSSMDSALLAEARREGVEVRTRASARIGGLDSGARRVEVRDEAGGYEVRAGLVLDASGLGGGAGRVLDPQRVRPGARVGLGAVFSGDAVVNDGHTLPDGEVHLFVAPEGYVGLVRLEDGTLDVAAAVDAEALRRAADPAELVGRILAAAGVRLDGPGLHGWRGTMPLTRSPERAAAPRVLRIGDAMGYVEPFTGEGIGWALASGRAAAGLAIRSGGAPHTSLEDAWRGYRADEAERARRFCRFVAWSVRHPVVVRSALSLITRLPQVAERAVRR